MRLKIILHLLIFSCGLIFGQQKIEFGILAGWYQPDLAGLDTSLESGSDQNSIMRKNVLTGFCFNLPLFPSARIGYAQGGSYYSGTSDTTEFKRKFIYRMAILETYFRPFRRIELNFSLAPMWNTAVINLDVKDTRSAWNTQIGNYNLEVKVPERIVNQFFGFTSSVGVRYYFLSWLALDVKSGFMSNTYKDANWKQNGKKIPGPGLDLNKEAMLTIRLMFSW